MENRWGFGWSDTATPNGTVRLLVRLLRGELISKELTARLAEIFTNDVGVILLPNGAR